MMRNGFYGVLLVAALAVGFGFGRHRSSRSPARTDTARQPLFYVDSMHPSYRSDKPGIAPDCGMQLTPVYAEELGGQFALPVDAGSGAVHIAPAAQQRYGIRVSPVGVGSGHETAHMFGRVAVDETRVYRINLGTDGYVKETHGDAVGTRVRKDQHLASVYSPEFLTVAGGYLSANERAPSGAMGAARENIAPTANAASAQARADRLRNLGMSDSQIDELSKSRKIPEDVYVVSPADGFIVARTISPGLRFERHTDLYTIADLRRVWILAQVSGNEAQGLRPGTVAKVILPGTGEMLKARVSDALPEVDAVTHTTTLRLEAENPTFKLRPNMFVDVELPVRHSAGLTVPADAVVDSGLQKRVFVETSEGTFEPREVQTGWHHDDEVQVVAGLKAGEMVATAGTFLIESESKLQAPSKLQTPATAGRSHRLVSQENHAAAPLAGEPRR